MLGPNDDGSPVNLCGCVSDIGSQQQQIQTYLVRYGKEEQLNWIIFFYASADSRPPSPDRGANNTFGTTACPTTSAPL